MQTAYKGFQGLPLLLGDTSTMEKEKGEERGEEGRKDPMFFVGRESASQRKL